MRKSLPLWLFILSFGAIAQNVAIKKVELAGEKVVVYYDLDDSNSTNEYQLNLYSSKDNFGSPLAKVTGAVGGEIKPGFGKKIEWNISQEYPGYKGRISLELRGKVYVAFVKLKDFDASKSYKRGKQYDILWKAGNTNPVNVELFKGNERIQGEMNRANNGDYVLNIPSGTKTGKDYRIKFTDSRSSDVIFSPTFKIVPKVPMFIKAAGALVVIGGGAAAASAGGGSKGGGGTGGGTGSSIPDPTLPTGN